jgi:TonB dependent receptor/TonB-dependent Receptor Plug Domain
MAVALEASRANLAGRVRSVVVHVVACIVVFGSAAGDVAADSIGIVQPIAGAAVVRGRVIDVRGQPIGGATVAIGARAATTDTSGGYSIAGAPLGADIVVTADGYAAGLATSSELVGDIVLSAGEAAGETITITGTPPPTAQGAGTLSRADLERLPGAGNDMLRALAAMPGVVSFALPLSTSGIAIRGSSPQDSKVLIDDFEVPMLYHDLGFRSIIPAEAIDQLEYIPGGFDVGFGRATSGIVRLTTRPGDTAGPQAEVSSSDAGALAQGRFRRGSYLLALRRSVIDQLLPALLPDNLDLALTTVPRYYDEQLRIDYAPTSKWALRLSSVGSDDVIELYTSRTTAADKRLYDRRRFIRLTTSATYNDGPWNARLALSGIVQQAVFERGTQQRIAVTTPAVTARGEVTRTLGAAAGLGDVTWRLGGETVLSRSTIDLALPAERREGEPPPVDDPMDTSQRFTGTIDNPSFAAWTSVGASLDRRIRLTAGLRLDAFERIDEVAVQPRGELAIKLRPTVTARLSAGAYRRPPDHQTELLAPGLASERATQLIAGLGVEPRPGVRLQGSAYYTDRSRLITRAPGGELTNLGRGTTHGAELLASLHHGPWFGWMTYAYSRSTRIDQPGGERRLFDYDQPHSLNVAASYRLSRRIGLGVRFRMYSGLPHTPVNGAVFDSDSNLYHPSFGAVNSERMPVHHELDLRLDRRWRWGPVQMTYFLDIQNVYVNQSPVGYIYSFDYQQRGAFRSLPILPTAGLRGEL